MICLWNNFHQLAAKNDFTNRRSRSSSSRRRMPHWPGEQADRAPGHLCRKDHLRRRTRRRHRQEMLQHLGSRGRRLYLRLYLRERRHRRRSAGKDKSFEQWARAKSFDTFGVFGPVIATGLDPLKLSVNTILNGKERQNYPVADMFFPPHKLVAAISQDMTLMPGDVIACGTSLGAGVMARRQQRGRHRDRRRRQPRAMCSTRCCRARICWANRPSRKRSAWSAPAPSAA